LTSRGTHPHILIDVLFRLRKRLDADIVAAGGRLPLLLTMARATDVPQDPESWQPPPPVGFHNPREPRHEEPRWSLDKRAAPFFPTRLILDFQDRSASRSARRSKDVQALLDDARREFEGLLLEAREHFRLAPDDSLRIACAGCRNSLFSNFAADALLGQVGARLLKKGSRHYATELARAIEQFGSVEFEWLGEAFPRSLQPWRSNRKEPPRWLRRMVERIQRALARDPSLSGVTGTLALLYYRKWGFWRRYPVTDASVEELLNHVAEASVPLRDGVLAVLVPQPDEKTGRLDNVILTKPELERAASAGIRTVLVDAGRGFFFDRDVGEPAMPKKKPRRPRPAPSAPRAKSPPLPDIYPL
jgi:hypothetical protein